MKLLLIGLSLASCYGSLSGKNVPAHAVCESYVDSAPRVVAPANDSTTISIKQARFNPSAEVNTQRFDHIETNTTPPSWLTSTPHTSQAKLVLAQHGGMRSMLPTMMISSFWKNSTGAAADGLHPVKGDSASANFAATTSTSRELVPYSKSDSSEGVNMTSDIRTTTEIDNLILSYLRPQQSLDSPRCCEGVKTNT